MAPVRSFLVSSAIVVLAVTQPSPSPRPTLDEWQNRTKNVSIQNAAVAANNSKRAAVDKAIGMLETLLSKVVAEKDTENVSYTKFTWWCADTTTERQKSIGKGETDETTLSGELGLLEARQTALNTRIETNLRDIKTCEETMQSLTKQREADHAHYEGNAKDIAAGLSGLEQAIQVLKASKTPSLTQIQSMRETLHTAVVLADALGLGGPAASSKVALFLQQPDIPMEDYKFRSGDIIATLENLLKDFRKTKNDEDAAEVTSVRQYDGRMQEQTHTRIRKNKDLDEARVELATTVEEIAITSKELATVRAALAADREYLIQLTQLCSDKADTFTQRSAAMLREVQALQQVISLMKEAGGVRERTSAATIRFAQQHASIRKAKSVAMNPTAMQAIELAAEAADAPALIQYAVTRKRFGLRASVRKASPQTADGRDAIIKMLTDEGAKLKSTLLASLASKIGKNDPFAKVKTLIQELLERLLQEADNEANQKGWCDKATSDAVQSRDFAARDIAEANSQMALLEADRDRLTLEESALNDEKIALEKASADAVSQRTKEHEQNIIILNETQIGLSTLSYCRDLLFKTYGTLKNEKVTTNFVEGPAEDAPDAGFRNFQAYTGSQSEAGGVMAMLDVIASDFERTLHDTRVAEEKARTEHIAFMTENGALHNQKVVSLSDVGAQKTETLGRLSDAQAKLLFQSQRLQNSLRELIDLKAACIDTGMSYEERVARRQDELAALNKALCMLENYGNYGPGAMTSNC